MNEMHEATFMASLLTKDIEVRAVYYFLITD
jgi:hypothetical protein